MKTVMFEDDLANQIGEVMAAEREHLDPRLERLALGTITDEEQAALEAEAAKDPQLAQAVELHHPLSADFRRRLANIARTSSQTLKPRLRLIVGGATGAILAAAAALILFSRLDVEPIPDYVLIAEAGDAVWRSEDAPKAPAMREDSEISIVLKPARIAKGMIHGELWIVTSAGEFRSDVQPEVSKDGAVRWLGAANVLSGGRTGEVKFVAFVGRAKAFPEPSARDGATHGKGWHSAALSVEILPLGVAP